MINKFARLLIIPLVFIVLSSLVSCYSVTAQKNPLKAPKSEDGKEVYEKHCLTCHQSDGSGVPNMFPPIRKSDWVNGDKNKLINLLLNGLQGDIDVNGESFSQVMPKQDSLTDVQIANLLTYIRKNFENNADSVKPAEVKNLREKK